MLSIADIREMLNAGRYRLTDHAMKRVVERNLTAQFIKEAGAMAEIIEDYPDDKYSPSCLLLGFARSGTPLHLQVSRMVNPEVKIITLYVPDEAEWIDFRYRRRKP